MKKTAGQPETVAVAADASAQAKGAEDEMANLERLTAPAVAPVSIRQEVKSEDPERLAKALAKLPKVTARYRVTRGGSFQSQGNMCRVSEGHIVKAVAYGKDGIDRMIECGIGLEPIAD